MNKSILLISLSILFTTAIFGQKVMTLSDCMDYALENHTEIRVAEYNKKDAEYQIKENAAVGLPQFNLGLSYSHYLDQPSIPSEALGFGEPGTEITFALRNRAAGTISFNQLIFNNSYLATIKGARMYKDYVDIQFEGVVEKLRNRVTDAYVPALVAAEGVRILELNISNQEKLVFETKANYKAGFVEQLDVDRLEYALAGFRTDRDALARQRDKAIDYLKFVMNMPVSDSITLKDDVDKLLAKYGDINPDEKLDYMNRPDYRAILKARDLNELQTNAYHRGWWPVLSFFASYDPTYQGNESLYWIPSSIMGLQMTMPIYDGGYRRAKEERSIIQGLKVEENKRQLTMAYDLEIETARKDYYSTKQKMEDQIRNLDLAQRIFDAAETKFKQGVGSSFEVTQAQYGLYQSQANLVNARFDFLKSLVAFKKALGQNR